MLRFHPRGYSAGIASIVLVAALQYSIHGQVAPETSASTQSRPYAITVMPPGGPPPRLPNGRVDFSGHWLPNSAGRGVIGIDGVDPAARRQFDPKVTPEERPSFQPWAETKIKAMSELDIELSRASVNCTPRGLPAIWLQNPYSTVILHTPTMMGQMFEILNNWRLIHLDGRPLPEPLEPWFHGNSTARWEGDTLLVESVGIDESTYVLPNGWFHSDKLRVVERYTRPSMNYLIVQITVDDPAVLQKPWTSAPRRWTLGDGEVFEYYCTNNREVEELQKLKEAESRRK